MNASRPPHREQVLVNKVGLAELTGRSLPTVDGWCRAGCPVVRRGGRGREWQFDPAQVVAWLERRASATVRAGGGTPDLYAARHRKLAADAAKREFEVQMLCKQYVTARDAGDRVAAEYGAVRTRLHAIPGRVARELSHLSPSPNSKVAECETVVAAEVEVVLRELSLDVKLRTS